jgi:membrane protease YdiL (CAAX protease family)
MTRNRWWKEGNVDVTIQPRAERGHTVVAILLFLLCGLVLAGAAYWHFIPQDTRALLKLSMAAVTLVGWLALRQKREWQPLAAIALGFFGASLGLLLAQVGGDWPRQLFGFSTNTIQGVALAKFGEALAIILPILGLHFATGGRRDGLFLKRGNLKLGLSAGVTGFAAFAAVAILQAIGSGLSTATVGAALPWIGLFIFANSFLEELWYRALFLKKLEPLTGPRAAIVVTALLWAAMHIDVRYVMDTGVFLVALVALGLLYGWLMRRTDSILAPFLIHAGSDVLVILGFLAGAEL